MFIYDLKFSLFQNNFKVFTVIKYLILTFSCHASQSNINYMGTIYT